MTGLMLHCGANNATREQVAAVQTPPNTATWFPIAHETLIQRVEQALGSMNMRVTQAAHALTKGGNRYFGLLQVANCQKTMDDYAYVLGLRNAHDMAFTASFVVGASVFVCDNLSFSGEIRVDRKHTKEIERDLPILTSRAVGLLSQKWNVMNDRIARYKEVEVTDQQAHDFIIRSLDVEATTLKQVPAILKEWRTPRHPEFAERKSAWRLFNAYTEVAKESSLTLLPRRTISLHALMDGQVGFAAPADKVVEGLEADAATVAINN